MDMVIPASEFQYGVKNRPNTPIQYVVGNFYGIQDEMSNNRFKQERMARSLVFPPFISLSTRVRRPAAVCSPSRTPGPALSINSIART